MEWLLHCIFSQRYITLLIWNENVIFVPYEIVIENTIPKYNLLIISWKPIDRVNCGKTQGILFGTLLLIIDNNTNYCIRILLKLNMTSYII